MIVGIIGYGSWKFIELEDRLRATQLHTPEPLVIEGETFDQVTTQIKVQFLLAKAGER